MEATVGSPVGVALEVVGGHEPEHVGRARSMTWDAASRTPLPPISPSSDPGCSRFAHETSRHGQEYGGTAACG
jgi:hypothetical protein